MLEAVASLGMIGLLFGGLLAFASKVFAVPIDPRVEAVVSVLPSAQCGACGYPGCAGFADAVVKGEAAANLCVPGGASTIAAINEILGLEGGEVAERPVAVVHCGGGAGMVSGRHLYDGIVDCRAAVIPAVAGKLGHTLCQWGCLGFGSCVVVCPFDAIYMGPEGLPVVDREKCTGCRKCVDACPRGIIELHPVSRSVHVLCRNTERGALVRRYCKVGCIACRACLRAVPDGFVVENNLSSAVYDKDLDHGLAIPRCPRKTIVDLAAPAPADAADAAKEAGGGEAVTAS